MPQTSFLKTRALLAHAVTLIFLVVIVTSCTMVPQITLAGEDMKYFKSPQQAVDSIKSMLRSEAWEELSRYYDLSGTDIDRVDLVSGEFFVRKTEPQGSHPGGFWKFKQPFSPLFSYLSHADISDEIVEVTVYVEIAEGGGIIQRGMDSLLLRKSSHGYQLLPK